MPPRPRPHLGRLDPYQWEASTQEIATTLGIPESEVVRFDTNTTPWPPVAWEQSVMDLPRLHANEYLHPSNEPLRSALAMRLGVSSDQVVVTNGADEALFLVAASFLGPGRQAVMANPSFAMFRVVTESVGGSILPVAVDETWDLPAGPLLDAVQQTSVTVVWLCTPNNPTGRVLDAALVTEVAHKAPNALVVVDEAYAEIAGTSLVHLLDKHPNLVIVRTFSKGYGLAGARVGYLVGTAKIAGIIDHVRLPQNLSVFGIATACRALADEEGLQRRVAALRQERDRLGAVLATRGWTVVPAVANFFLARPPVNAGDLADWLQQAGLVVRTYRGHPRLTDWLRVTVRAPEEDDRLVARIDSFR